MRIERLPELLLSLTGFYASEKVTIVSPGNERHGDVEYRRFFRIPFTDRRWYIERQVIDHDEDAPDEYPSSFTP